jgi:hypothetical protein
MRTLLPTALAAGLLFTHAGLAPAQDGARAILEKAIKAHGGQEKLAKFRASRARFKGVVLIGDTEAPFSAQMAVQLPDKLRVTLQARYMNREQTVTQVLNGDKGWISVDGQTREPSAEELARLKMLAYADHVVRLVPLLQEKGFELTVLKETKVNDRPAVGVKVASTGHPDISLYFDKESGLLIKTERQVTNNLKRMVLQEDFHSDFKDMDGYKRPTRSAVYQDGKKVTEGTLLEIRDYQSLPDSEFAKP